jgi:hypothetical protein
LVADALHRPDVRDGLGAQNGVPPDRETASRGGNTYVAPSGASYARKPIPCPSALEGVKNSAGAVLNVCEAAKGR